MGIRPQDIHLDAKGGIESEVSLVEPMGRDDLIVCRVGEMDIHFLVDPVMKLKMDDRIKVKFDMEQIQLFDTESELSLLWS